MIALEESNLKVSLLIMPSTAVFNDFWGNSFNFRKWRRNFKLIFFIFYRFLFASLAFLLNGRNHSPWWSARSNNVLVGYREQVTLFVREFLKIMLKSNFKFHFQKKFNIQCMTGKCKGTKNSVQRFLFGYLKIKDQALKFINFIDCHTSLLAIFEFSDVGDKSFGLINNL